MHFLQGMLVALHSAHSRVILDYPPLLLFEIDHGVIVGAPTKSPPLRSTINKENAF